LTTRIIPKIRSTTRNSVTTSSPKPAKSSGMVS
jgi:hypothetical protein